MLSQKKVHHNVPRMHHKHQILNQKKWNVWIIYHVFACQICIIKNSIYFLSVEKSPLSNACEKTQSVTWHLTWHFRNNLSITLSNNLTLDLNSLMTILVNFWNNILDFPKKLSLRSGWVIYAWRLTHITYGARFSGCVLMADGGLPWYDSVRAGCCWLSRS